MVDGVKSRTEVKKKQSDAASIIDAVDNVIMDSEKGSLSAVVLTIGRLKDGA